MKAFLRILPALFLTAAVCFSSLAQAGLSVLRDEETEQMLKALGRPIFQEAGLSPDTVRFILVSDDNLNAFVAGGQNIFVNTGLILETKSPEELAGVIAHETGHIAGGHLFRTAEALDDLTFQTMLANIIGMAAAAGAKSGDVGIAAATAGSGMAMRAMLRHSRVQESSADQAGIRYLKDAGLPIEGFLSFMEKLSSQELLPESQQSEYVRTHPLARDRVDFLEQMVKENKKPGVTPAGWKDLHARIKTKLMGYLYPDRALADKSNTITAQYGRAVATWRKGKNPEALALLEKLIKAEPDNPYFHELTGQIWTESGNSAKALPAYRKASALAPFSGLIRASYGRALLENDRLEEAIAELQKSLDREPRSPETHRFLAVAYGRQGKEGLASLHLAEGALMTNRIDFAKREAALAKQNLPKGSPGWLRADDIQNAIKKRKKKDN